MSPAPSQDNAPPDRRHAESGPADGFAKVLVYAGILHATAVTLELLHDFFIDADPVVRIHLGRFLIACDPQEDTGDPGMEAIILLNELTEAAVLLHTLAGDTGKEAPA
jgi:hypothetical protein